MKILAFSHTGLVTGGAEQCLLEYIDILTSRGHTCKVIIPHEGAMQKTLTKKKIENKIIGYGWAIRPHKKVNTHKVLASNGNSLAKIFHEVEKFKPDAILVNTSVIPWGLYAGRMLGISTILLVHEIINEKDPSLDVLPNYKDYAGILNENTDIVLYNSEFVRNEYKDDLTKPLNSKKILYPLPPLDKEKISNLFKENIIDDELRIAIFGALAPRKNQLEALEAIKILKDGGNTNFKIDLYGDIAANLPYVKILKDYINKNSLESYVKVKGYTTSVYETMNQYNMILSTSTYEPFGRTIIEGQLFGRIVIANNTGGGPELIRHGETGLMYKLGNPKDLAKQISWVLAHKEKALMLAKKAKTAQVKKFITDSRYDALIDAVEYLGENKNQQKVSDDLFNPIRSLYEYNHQLNEKYKNIERVTHNRVTRAIKHFLVRAKLKTKRLVKEVLVKL